MHRAHVQSVRDGLAKFLAIVSNRPARPPQRERRPNHQRKSQLVAQTQRILRIVHQRRRRHFQANFSASILKPQPVFRNFDSAQRRANHLDFVFFENPAFAQFHGKVQRRLPANGGQQCIRFFLRNNFLEIFLRQRLDIGAIGQFWIGHDRRRIGVHQHDVVALRAQRLARLRPGIVELARLPNDDRPRANNQNLLDVFALRH